MKKYLLLFLIFLGAVSVKGQQKALYSQYMTNYYLLNPAVTGFEKDWKINTGFRNQWVGFEGAPKTLYLSAHTAILKDRKKKLKPNQGFQGVGGYLYSDKTGPTSRSGFQFSYAYHAPLSKGLFASAGMFAGVQQFSFDPNKIQLADNSNSLDPVTRDGQMSAFMPDLSVGTYLHSEAFYLGASLFQVLGNKIFTIEEANIPSRLRRHLFMAGGLNLKLDKYFILTPSLLVKYAAGSPWQTDINLKGEYNLNNRKKSVYDDKIWAGLSYRTDDAVVGMLGIHFMEQMEFSYSYDITVSPLRNYNSGSHELVFGFRIISR